MRTLPCRVCLKTENPTIDMLSSPLPICEETNLTILQMFTEICEIAMEVGDNSVLCISCQIRLIEAYKFRAEAQNAVVFLDKITPMEPVEDVTKDKRTNHFQGDPVLVEETKPLMMVGESKQVKQNQRVLMPPLGILNKFNCRFCLRYLKGQLREHELHHITQNGGLECYFCAKKFRTRKLILEHLQGVHFTDKSDPNRIRYSCDICGRSYSEKGSLRNHKRDKHSNNPKIVQKKICPHCGEPKKDMLKHIELVHSNKDVFYPCETCGKSYRSKESLRNHQRLTHMVNELKYQCQECCKFYRTNGELKSHMNGVHGEDQQLPCETCGKVLKSQITLRFHMKMHRATLDFRCQQCNLAFKTNAYLIKHMKVHSDSKDYVCKYCSMAFKHSGMLSKHMKMHTGEFFYCSQCPSESFIDGYSLRLHNEKVHLGITYRCDTCTKEYGTRKHLKQHQNAQGHDVTKWTKVVPELVTESKETPLQPEVSVLYKQLG